MICLKTQKDQVSKSKGCKIVSLPGICERNKNGRNYRGWGITSAAVNGIYCTYFEYFDLNGEPREMHFIFSSYIQNNTNMHIFCVNPTEVHLVTWWSLRAEFLNRGVLSNSSMSRGDLFWVRIGDRKIV